MSGGIQSKNNQQLKVYILISTLDAIAETSLINAMKCVMTIVPRKMEKLTRMATLTNVETSESLKALCLLSNALKFYYLKLLMCVYI